MGIYGICVQPMGTERIHGANVLGALISAASGAGAIATKMIATKAITELGCGYETWCPCPIGIHR